MSFRWHKRAVDENPQIRYELSQYKLKPGAPSYSSFFDGEKQQKEPKIFLDLADTSDTPLPVISEQYLKEERTFGLKNRSGDPMDLGANRHHR